MSEVYRPSYHAIIPPDAKFTVKAGKRYAKFRLSKSGELVTGEVLPSGKARIRTPYYFARVKIGKKSTKRSTGCKDKESALAVRQKLQREYEQGRAGIIDKYEEWRGKPMLTHLDDYIVHLESKGRAAKHVRETKRTIKAVIAACHFDYPENVAQHKLDRYLGSLISGKKPKSYRTRNAAMKAIRALATWMVKSRRLEFDPFMLCETLCEDQDPNRRKRRSLSVDDFAKLVAAAEQGIEKEGVSGRERSILYICSASTGLRRGELSKLLVGNFDLDAEVPFVFPPGHVVKNGKESPLPLHPLLLDRLRSWFDGKKPTDPAFHLISESGRNRCTARMIAHDCKIAGIEYNQEIGGTCDFHGVGRAGYITALCRSGADFSLVVRLARHSDSRLTTRVYDKVQLGDMAHAVNALQLPAPAKA